jgi:hypothetical protein
LSISNIKHIKKCIIQITLPAKCDCRFFYTMAQLKLKMQTLLIYEIAGIFGLVVKYHPQPTKHTSNIKHRILCTIAFLSHSLIFAQTKIANTLTAKHITIEGTKISLVPPAGFIKAANFLGTMYLALQIIQRRWALPPQLDLKIATPQ